MFNPESVAALIKHATTAEECACGCACGGAGGGGGSGGGRAAESAPGSN